MMLWFTNRSTAAEAVIGPLNTFSHLDKGLGICGQQIHLHGARIAESKNILSLINKDSFLKIIDLAPGRLLAPIKIIFIAGISLHNHIHRFIVIPLHFEV